ncbi:MAG: dATP/dGTP pyrophosphohydrolase domain-containing protein [Bacteroidota bacterium]
MSSHCNKYPGCGCGPEVGTKCHIKRLGSPVTVGDLQDLLNNIPFGADFGFRNQPMQVLYYDKNLVSCYFDGEDLDEINPTFNLFQQVHGIWSDKTFGTRSPLGPLHHLLKEVKEVIENPDDIEEYADCGLLLMDSLRLAGYSMDQLYSAMFRKYQKNKCRTWAKPDENGTCEHIREGE